MGCDLYIARIRDPDHRYSLEDEAWRSNLELLVHLRGSGPELLERAEALAAAAGRRAEQVDWATWFAEVTLAEVLDLLGPPVEVDVRAWRPYHPGSTDAEIRRRYGFDGAEQAADLDPAERYAIVSVERI